MSHSRREFIRKSSLLSGGIVLNLPSYLSEKKLNDQNGNRLILLGTQGGPFLHSYRQTPAANLIVYKGIPIVIDTGMGVTFKLLDIGINLSSIKYIFITHHHSDHNLEMGPLLYNIWISGLKETINVYAPSGLVSMLSHFWQSNQFDIETRIENEGRQDIRTLVVTHEYSEGSVMSNSDFEVSALKNNHPPVVESYALRFKLGDKVIVFSGDTVYYPQLSSFALNADYVVHEVMYVSAIEEMVKRRPNANPKLTASILSHHTSAEDAGRIASAAMAKNLVLTHFIPADDAALTEQVWIDAVRTTFSGNIIVGKDLLEIPL